MSVNKKPTLSERVEKFLRERGGFHSYGEIGRILGVPARSIANTHPVINRKAPELSYAMGPKRR